MTAVTRRSKSLRRLTQANEKTTLVDIGVPRKPAEMRRVLLAAFLGVLVGISIGVSSTKYGLITRIPVVQVPENISSQSKVPVVQIPQNISSQSKVPVVQIPENYSVPKIPKVTPERSYRSALYRGAEVLPPGIVVPTTDLYLRRLWGNPDEDLPFKQKYLVTFTVGFDQREIVNAAVSKFSKNWTIVLFHYDGRTNEWDEFEWAKEVIHISAKKQSKWWFAKRFLHPDVVASFEYILIWDEDLDVQHFNAEEYIRLVKKHGLDISQPGLEPDRGLTWQMTKRRGNSEVHKTTEERPGWCEDPHKPPCAGFVEIMAPAFSRDAWRCVWHMIQNDLVHGWGLDFALGRCVQPAYEKIGVVDSQYIIHKVVPSLGNQGQSADGRPPWEGVRQRCNLEWQMFRERMRKAEKDMATSLEKSS